MAKKAKTYLDYLKPEERARVEEIDRKRRKLSAEKRQITQRGTQRMRRSNND